MAGQGFSLDVLSLKDNEIPPVPTLPARSPSRVLAPRHDGVSLDVTIVDEATETEADSPSPTSIRSAPRPENEPTPETRSTKPSPDVGRGTPSPSPIQTWLNSSYESSKPDEPPGIPLPPDVVDNLRTSIACFPDTTLLTSSLSVETIRSYSRKVKTFPAEVLTQTAGYSGKRWRLGRILGSSRRSNASSGSRAPRDDDVEAPTPVAPWEALRSVFDGGSEFLCDALYAHIVAYNYVSTLRPRPSQAKSASIAPQKDDEVPKKAAALLGLRPDAAAEGPSSGRPSGETLPGPSERRDGALRELVVGLLRCISRLVVTLREGRAEVSEEEGCGVGDVDVLLLRSLCELVRCSEER